MESLNKELKTNNEKTEKEKENWISQEAVLERLEELKKQELESAPVAP